jgi:hypothetical protein
MQNIEFKDEFEEETDICCICGSEMNLTGWNEEKDLSRFECDDCGAIFVFDSEGNETMQSGQKRNWSKFLSEALTFPFDARIDEHQGDNLFKESGPLRYGDKVVVKKLTGDFDLYGIIAEIKKGSKTYQTPLCDLAAIDENSSNDKTLDKYRTWFANCR